MNIVAVVVLSINIITPGNPPARYVVPMESIETCYEQAKSILDGMKAAGERGIYAAGCAIEIPQTIEN